MPLNNSHEIWDCDGPGCTSHVDIWEGGPQTEEFEELIIAQIQGWWEVGAIYGEGGGRFCSEECVVLYMATRLRSRWERNDERGPGPQP